MTQNYVSPRNLPKVLKHLAAPHLISGCGMEARASLRTHFVEALRQHLPKVRHASSRPMHSAALSCPLITHWRALTYILPHVCCKFALMPAANSRLYQVRGSKGRGGMQCIWKFFYAKGISATIFVITRPPIRFCLEVPCVNLISAQCRLYWVSQVMDDVDAAAAAKDQVASEQRMLSSLFAGPSSKLPSVDLKRKLDKVSSAGHDQLSFASEATGFSFGFAL